MFETIRDGLDSALKTLTGKGKLTEANMRDGLALVRKALLEADVSFPVVKTFMERVTEQATGEKVLKSLDPTRHLLGIVYNELIALMGPVDSSLHLRPETTVLMLCGLQGSGKTTTCAKLARTIQKNQRSVMLVAADLQRPAAIHQLQVLGEQLGVPVHAGESGGNPVKVCQEAVKEARRQKIDVVILDTAGRLHVDDQLMGELTEIDNRVSPDQVYLVVDSMTGQDAVNSADAFNKALELNGVILTKLDGDARGGAALSVKEVTGVPIKFIGVGEHIDELDEFNPERMAGRILGQGDIVGLMRDAREKFDEDEMKRQEEALRAGQFTLDDFRKQITQIKRLGPMSKVLSMIPGMDKLSEMMGSDQDPEKDLKRLSGIIDSMTENEKRNPTRVIDQSRRRRIAAGAGVEPHEISELVKQFEGMADMMKKMSGMGMKDRMNAVRELQGDLMNPGARLGKQKQGTGKRLSNAEKAKLRKQRAKDARKKRKSGKQR